MTRAYPAGAARLVYAGIAVHFVIAPLLAVIIATLVGCGASALEVNAKAADTMEKVTNAATGELETTYKHRQLGAVEDACGTTDPAEATEPCQAEATDAVDDVQADWDPVWAAHETLRSVHDSYRETLQLAAAADLDEPLRWARLAARLVNVYQALVAAAKSVDVRLPPTPGALSMAASLVPRSQ